MISEIDYNNLIKLDEITPKNDNSRLFIIKFLNDNYNILRKLSNYSIMLDYFKDEKNTLRNILKLGERRFLSEESLMSLVGKSIEITASNIEELKIYYQIYKYYKSSLQQKFFSSEKTSEEIKRLKETYGFKNVDPKIIAEKLLQKTRNMVLQYFLENKYSIQYGFLLTNGYNIQIYDNVKQEYEEKRDIIIIFDFFNQYKGIFLKDTKTRNMILRIESYYNVLDFVNTPKKKLTEGEYEMLCKEIGEFFSFLENQNINFKELYEGYDNSLRVYFSQIAQYFNNDKKTIVNINDLYFLYTTEKDLFYNNLIKLKNYVVKLSTLNIKLELDEKLFITNVIDFIENNEENLFNGSINDQVLYYGLKDLFNKDVYIHILSIGVDKKIIPDIKYTTIINEKYKAQFYKKYKCFNFEGMEDYLSTIYNSYDYLINDFKKTEEYKKYGNNGINYTIEIPYLLGNITVRETLSFNSQQQFKEEIEKFLCKKIYLISEYTSELSNEFNIMFSLPCKEFTITITYEKVGANRNEKDIELFLSKEHNPFFQEDFILYNPSGAEKRCMIKCFKYNKLQLDIKTLNNLNITFDNGIYLNQLEKLSHTFEVKIELFNHDEKKKYWTYGEQYNQTIYLICEDNHLSTLVKTDENNKPKKIDKTLSTKIVAWDIETITQSWNDNILKDISISWCSLLEKEVENYDWENFKDYYLNKVEFSYEPDSAYNKYISSLDIFIEYVCRESKDYKLILIGYNSSAFDCFLLIDRIKEKFLWQFGLGSNISIFSVKNRIYNIRMKNIECIDLFLHFRMSLMNACKSFNAQPSKIETNIIWDIQDAVNNKSFQQPNIQQQFKEELEKYNKFDVLCLFSLLSNYWKLLNKLQFTKGIKPHNFITSPSLINSVFKKLYKKYNIVKPYTRDDFIAFKKTQRAGTVGIFGYEGYSKYVENIHLYDMTSQYPYVCLKYEFPSGDYIFETFEDEREPDLQNKLGIYYCETDMIDIHIPFAPTRDTVTKDIEKNNWQTQKEIVYVPLITQIINYLRNELKRKVKIVEGWTFESKCYLFKDTMEELMNLKIEQDKLKLCKKYNLNYDGYDEMLRGFYKYMLNGQTGAVNQNLHETEIQFDQNLNTHYINKKKFYLESALEKMYRKTRGVSRPYLGTFIYSLARLELLKIAGSLNKEIIYGDTDSLIITNKGNRIWLKNKELKKRIMPSDNSFKGKTKEEIMNSNYGEFGLMKYDGNFEKGYFIDKKLYCLNGRKDIEIKNPCNEICVCVCDKCKNLNKTFRCEHILECPNNIFKLKGVIKQTSYTPIKKDFYQVIYFKQLEKFKREYIKEKIKIWDDNLSVEEHNKLIHNNLYNLTKQIMYDEYLKEFEQLVYCEERQTIYDVKLYKYLLKGYCIETYRNRLKRNIRSSYKIYSVDEVHITQHNLKPKLTFETAKECLEMILSQYVKNNSL